MGLHAVEDRKIFQVSHERGHQGSKNVNFKREICLYTNYQLDALIIIYS